MDIKQIKQQAIKEIEKELFRKEVDAYKEKLRNRRSFWDIFPYKILIIRKEK
jgi:hypothetical protein